jgi:hypothetical protein
MVIKKSSEAGTARVVGGDEKGSLKSETVKYERQTCPLVREGAPQKQDRNCQIVLNTYLVMSPIWGSTPRLTD